MVKFTQTILFIAVIVVCVVVCINFLSHPTNPFEASRQLWGTSFFDFFGFFSGQSNKENKGKGVSLRKRKVTVNNVTFVYIVGLEAAGVESITPVIATIAKTCGKHVLFGSPDIRSARLEYRLADISKFLEGVKGTTLDRLQNGVVLLEEGVFPGDKAHKNTSFEEKKADAHYNIEWIYNAVQSVGGIQQKYLWVNRNFHKTLLNQKREKNSSNTWQDIANMLQSNIQLIDRESKIISTNASSALLWRQVRYEWFQNGGLCPTLVSSIIEFAGWDHCDVSFACQLIRTNFIPAHDKVTGDSIDDTIISDEIAGNYTVPTFPMNIPALNISNRAVYNFTKVISRRKYFRYLPLNYVPTPASKNKTKGRPYLAPRPRSPARDYFINNNSPIRNEVSYVYIVGVEGTGHHGVTPAIASIAKTCRYHVIYEDVQFRQAMGTGLPLRFKSLLNNYKRKVYARVNKVLVLEDGSFPTDQLHRYSTMGVKKNCTKYNIEWVYDQTHEMNVDVRFLHLSRDFYRTVASHPEFDGGFNKHADVLHSFLKYIDSEYARIEAKQPNLWRTIYYEWFQDLSNCTALASAIIDFAGWNDCDVEFACEILMKTIKKSTKRVVDEGDYAYSNSLNTTLAIPVLDISEDRVFSFNSTLSERISFSYLDEGKKSAARGKLSRYYSRPSRTQRPLHGANYSFVDTSPFDLKPHYSSSRTAATLTNRVSVSIELSMIYLVGVLGAGHAEVATLVSRVARSCGYRVQPAHKSLQRAQTRLNTQLFKSVLSGLSRTRTLAAPSGVTGETHPNSNNSNSNASVSDMNRVVKILLIEGVPFYASSEHLTNTSDDIRRIGHYNLAWLQARTVEAEVETKFLYLNRSFPDVLAASRTTSTLFEEHTRGVGGFISYIGEEQRKIEERWPGSWAQVEYEWLDELDNDHCVSLVASIIQFAGWSDCDLAQACANSAVSHADYSKYVKLDKNQTSFARLFEAVNIPPLLIPRLNYSV